MSITPAVLRVRTFPRLESSANEKLEVHRTGKSTGEGCVGDLHNLIRGSKSGADW